MLRNLYSICFRVQLLRGMSTVTGCNLRWNLNPDGIKEKTDLLITRIRSTFDRLGAIENPTFESFVLPLSLFEAVYYTESNEITFPKHVCFMADMRGSSCEASRKLADVEVELEMRKDIFDKFVAVKSKLDSSVSSEFHRYVDKKIKSGRCNGLHLDEKTRQEIEKLNKEENQLAIDFEHALNEENTLLEFTNEELVGCPDEFIQSLKQLPNGKREITIKYPHYFTVAQQAWNPETRRKMAFAFNSRCIKENTPILKRLMEIRKQRSLILGFPTHADFVLDIRMAKNAANVEKFLSNLGSKLENIRQKEKARLLELKKEECLRLKLEFTNQLDPWDMQYYQTLVKKKDYNVDVEMLKKYFPLSKVKAGVLNLYQHLLGLKFEKVDNPEVWFDGVEMYGTYDSASNKLLGYFYLDLHPREGKYGHAAVFGLQPGCFSPADDKDAFASKGFKRQISVAAMVANFPEPDKGSGEAYMLHDDVETFFHEFGHLMHHICAQTETSLFSGTNVETDFVECPSQMLENWVWCEEGLKFLLGTDRDPMPKELLHSLLLSRNANAALFYSRQLLLATFDQDIHKSQWNVDPVKTLNDLSEKLVDMKPIPGTFMGASFGHLAGGYDARYYSYLWSKVFSEDMFESRFRHAPDGGCLSKTVGLDYRNTILHPGGSKDAVDMLRNFLGREPNDQAFFKSLGFDG